MDEIIRLETEIYVLKKELAEKEKQLYEARLQRVEKTMPTKLLVSGDVSLKELPIKTRILNGLLRSGYFTLADLNGVSKETLISGRNIGKRGVISLFETLSELGVTIRDETIVIF